MGKTVRVVQLTYKWNLTNVTAPMKALSIRGYLTQTAGLAVCKTHKLNFNTATKEHSIDKKSTWDIMTYPSGFAVLQGFQSKQEAIEAAETELAPFSWVCIFFADFQKNNDMNKVRKAMGDVRKTYGL